MLAAGSRPDVTGRAGHRHRQYFGGRPARSSEADSVFAFALLASSQLQGRGPSIDVRSLKVGKTAARRLSSDPDTGATVRGDPSTTRET